jgi:hypothetical protein
MRRRAFVASVASMLALAWLCIPVLAAAPGAAPPEVAKTALAFAGALAKDDLTPPWQLLSSKTRSHMNAVQWEQAFRGRAPSRVPSGNDLLRALATAEQPPTIGDVLLQDGEALIKVSGTVRITQNLVLVKEGGAWLVDLAASDEINSREAARVFMDAVGSTSAASTPRPVRTPESSLPMLRALLVPEAKSYYVLNASVQGDRADVTLACDLPVSLVLRAVRSGPGWMVDVSRPIVNTNPMSPDPLREAAESNIQATCQDQLRQLGRAFQMYAAANDDKFPDADRWVDQLRPYLGEAATALHCPADKTPGVSYAMNRNLAGKTRSTVANQQTTPLLFESTLHTANPADTGESWPSAAFHMAGNMVLFVDGNARPVVQKPSFSVIEGPRLSAGQRPSAQPERPKAQLPQRRIVPRARQPQRQPAP